MLIWEVQKKKNDHVTFSDITNLFSRILRGWKFLFLNVFCCFSFWQSRCLICNLNSKGNLTRKHLNFNNYFQREGGGGGGFQFLFYKFIQTQTEISQLIYEILQFFFQLSTPFYQIFQEKKEFGRFKNLKFM